MGAPVRLLGRRVPAAEVAEHQRLEVHLLDGPGGVDHRAIHPREERCLALGVGSIHDRRDAGHGLTGAARPDQDAVGPQQVVHLAPDGDSPVAQHHQVIAHALQIGDEMG